MPSRHRFLESIHNVKEGRNEAPHISAPPVAARRSGLHTWKIGERFRAPSVAAKLRLVARFAALAVLAAVRISRANSSPLLRSGGAYRDRTDDLKLAKLALSQLS
jgi:hypothetical protein